MVRTIIINAVLTTIMVMAVGLTIASRQGMAAETTYAMSIV